MKFRILPLLLAAAFLSISCSSDDDSNASVKLTIAGSDGQESVIQAGESAELDVEDRSAVLLVVEGIVPSSGKYETELVKVYEGVYRDHDEGQGPEFWLMEAVIEDDGGNTLWTDRENSLFQLLEFLEIVLSQQADINISSSNVYRFVKAQYPQLLNFAVRVPTGIAGGKDYVLRMPDADGNYYEVGRWAIADLVEQAEPSAYEGEVATLVNSGPPEDNIDIVVLGDGYTVEDREKFDLDAQAVAEALMDADPFKTHNEMINIHTVWTPSAETGAGYDCTGNPLADGMCKADLRDTVFGTTFVVTALGDLLNFELGASDRVAMPLEVARLYEVAALANYDEIVLISNTRRASGFAGLYVSVVTTFDTNRNQFPNVAVHELGHSFGVLGDEYQVEGDACLFNEPRVPLPANIAPLNDPMNFKWSRWFNGPTPIPTPAAEKEEFPIGAYLGAYNCDDLYRPAHDCKMNSDEGRPFCSVCNEQVTRRIYSVLDPLANTPPSATVLDSGAVEFQVGLHESDVWDVNWTLNDQEIGTGATVQVDAKDLPSGEFGTVRATITERTGFILVDDPNTTQTVEFQVKR